MKRKVKKFAEGGTNVRTRTDEEFAEDSKFGGYGRYMPKTKSITLGGKSSAEEDRPISSGVEDYATLGKRAGAVSTMSGPKEYISESIKEDTEKETESPKGIASGFKSGESKFERNDNEVKMPAAKKKRKTSDVTKKSYGFNEDPSYKTLPGIASDKDAKSKTLPEKTDSKKEYYRDFSGKIKEKTPDTNSFKDFGEMIAKGAGALGRGIRDYASTIKSPAQRRDEEKASKEKGFAKGGKVSSASSRGDGIAQRGKTKGRMC